MLEREPNRKKREPDGSLLEGGEGKKNIYPGEKGTPSTVILQGRKKPNGSQEFPLWYFTNTGSEKRYGKVTRTLQMRIGGG